MSDDLSAMWQPLKSVPIARQRGTRDGISTTFQHFRHVGNNEFPGFIFLFFFPSIFTYRSQCRRKGKTEMRLPQEKNKGQLNEKIVFTLLPYIYSLILVREILTK